MSYGKDCYAAVELEHEVESLRTRVHKLESDLNALRRDLNDEIGSLRARVNEIPGSA